VKTDAQLTADSKRRAEIGAEVEAICSTLMQMGRLGDIAKTTYARLGALFVEMDYIGYQEPREYAPQTKAAA